MSKQIEVKVQGHPKSTLGFWPMSRCGEIDDGVGFNHGNEGGWVISFADLERMYKAALAARSSGNGSAPRE